VKRFLLLACLGLLPVFKFYSGLGFDDKTGYLLSSSASNPGLSQNYEALQAASGKILSRCDGDRKCESSVRGRLASLKNYPLQSSLITFWKKIFEMRWSELCRGLPWAMLFSFLTQSVLFLGLMVWCGASARTANESHVTFLFFLAGLLALYGFSRDINFCLFNGKASGAVGLLAMFSATAFCLRRDARCFASLLFLPFVHLGQATFLTLFFAIAMGIEWFFDRGGKRQWSWVAALLGFVGCLVYSWTGFQAATSEPLPLGRMFAALTSLRYEEMARYLAWDRLGVLAVASGLLLAVRSKREEVLPIPRYWVLLATSLIFLWGVWFFQVALAGSRPNGEVGMYELFDRIYGNLEFLVLSFPLLFILHSAKRFRFGTAVVFALCALSGAAKAKEFVFAIPGAIQLARVEVCQAVSLADLKKRLQSPTGWTSEIYPKKEPEFNLMLYLYLEGD